MLLTGELERCSGFLSLFIQATATLTKHHQWETFGSPKRGGNYTRAREWKEIGMVIFSLELNSRVISRPEPCILSASSCGASIVPNLCQQKSQAQLAATSPREFDFSSSISNCGDKFGPQLFV